MRRLLVSSQGVSRLQHAEFAEEVRKLDAGGSFIRQEGMLCRPGCQSSSESGWRFCKARWTCGGSCLNSAGGGIRCGPAGGDSAVRVWIGAGGAVGAGSPCGSDAAREGGLRSEREASCVQRAATSCQDVGDSGSASCSWMS